MTTQLKGSALPISDPQGNDHDMLISLQRETFEYFLKEVSPDTGLIADKTDSAAPSSIAAVGLGLCTYLCGVEHGWIKRGDAIERILKILRFLNLSEQSTELDATGYKGFYYHFLDMKSGKRVWNCELSTIDTAILIAGVLTVATYFNLDSSGEKEIRDLADLLYDRVDWRWALNGEKTLSHGWKPESGFLKYRWDFGYSEAIILYVLAQGSPTFSIDPAGYKAWSSTFEWKCYYNLEYIYAGPLFIHQLSHVWIDFRGIQDEVNRKYGLDYFENSRRATLAQRKYAIENPIKFEQYGEDSWGFTASDGPGSMHICIENVEHEFFDYYARGAPGGPDDGTLSPWAAASSVPFAPEEVLHSIRQSVERLLLKKHSYYGLKASFNPSFPDKRENPFGWVSPWQFGLNQGPVILMIENYKSELIWNLCRRCPHIIRGLKSAGFRGAWLES